MHSSPDAPADAPMNAAAGVRRLSGVDLAVLALIGIVVVLVSLPRLRRFALHENETDAIRALRSLADEALAREELAAPGELAALVAPVLPGPSGLGRRARLEDVEVLPDGRLRLHGYVFDWIESEGGGAAIVAWPWEHGRTGISVFAIEPGGPVLGLANEDGRYSGPRRPPPAPHTGQTGPASAQSETLAWTALRPE